MSEVDDTRLGELLDRYQELRAAEPEVSPEVLRAEAGPLYDELVDLVDCLELVLEERPASSEMPLSPALAAQPLRQGTPTGSDKESRPWLSRWWPLLLALALLAVAGGLLSAREPARLEVIATEGASVTLDDARIPESLEPGTYTLRVALADHHPFEEALTLKAGEHLHRHVFLAPTDPFERKDLEAMAEGLGLSLLPLSDILSAPLQRAHVVAAAALRESPRNEEAIELERALFPAYLRETAAARYILGRRLLRIGEYAACVSLAQALVREYPGRSAPILLGLRALSALSLEESDLYAELHALYRGDDAESKR